MDNVLKVTPEKLMETAEEFRNTEAGIRGITQEMISLVDGFKPIWQGEAATGFSARFSTLSEDMNRLYTFIRTHADDLTEMANEYRLAEEESQSLAQSLDVEAVI